MKIIETIPNLKMNLQLFAEKGEEVAAAEPQADKEEFVYDENFFTGAKDEETPDFLNEDEETETEEETEEETETIPDKEEEVPEDVKQSKEANSAFADLRRQKKEHEKEMKALDEFARGQGATDMKDYMSKMSEQVEANTKAELEEKGYDLELLEKAWKLTNKPAEKEVDVEAVKAAEDSKLFADYDALQVKYPEFVTKPEDIDQEVWDKYDKGYDLIDAFKLVNADKLNQVSTKKAKEIARQETLNKINSKKHLKTEKESASAGNDVFVDKETLAIYKSMGITEKQAIKFQKQFLK